jgi:hypothetical protein
MDSLSQSKRTHTEYAEVPELGNSHLGRRGTNLKMLEFLEPEH